MRYLHAYNTGDLATLKKLVTSDLIFSDCNYRKGKAVELHGWAEVSDWLRHQFRNDDQLKLNQINGRTQESGDSRSKTVYGVSFSRRTSDALTAQGHPHGITPDIGAKVFFSHGSIKRFVMGPGGGSGTLCQV